MTIISTSANINSFSFTTSGSSWSISTGTHLFDSLSNFSKSSPFIIFSKISLGIFYMYKIKADFSKMQVECMHEVYMYPTPPYSFFLNDKLVEKTQRTYRLKSKHTRGAIIQTSLSPCTAVCFTLDEGKGMSSSHKVVPTTVRQRYICLYIVQGCMATCSLSHKVS